MSSKTNLSLNNILSAAGWFIFVFFFFFIVHTTINGFFGSDPYYHAAHSSYYFDRWYYVENWIELHFFSSRPVDPYFLFHKFGGEFIELFGKDLGFKIYGSILAGIAVSVFFIILKLLQVKKANLWTIFFLFSSPFFFSRLFLIRSFLLAIPLILICYYFIKKEKWLYLFITSFFYSLYYTLGVFVLIIETLFTAVMMYQKGKIYWRPLFYSFLGISFGIALHPQSLNYLYQIYIHTVDIFYLKAIGVKLPTGTEINLSSFSDLLFNNYLTVLLYLPAIAVFLGGYKTQKLKQYSPLFVISLFWFLLMTFIPRAVEYWHPFAILFSAVIFSNVKIPQAAWDRIKNKLYWDKSYITKAFLVFVISILLVINATATTAKRIERHRSGAQPEHYREVAENISKVSKNKELIFFTNWSLFPKFFYYNQKNRYITGFDPVFAYRHNPKKYWLWLNLSTHAQACKSPDLCPTESVNNHHTQIKQGLNQLKVDYIILQKEDKLLKKTLEQIKSIEFLLQNKYFTVFRVK
ncbi:MAG: hypothetical protein ABEJ02_01160 [Candidatus Paceibacteria bacterium]